MHQSRKTHNAHNETQRRLKKVILNMSTVLWSNQDPVFFKYDRRNPDGGFYSSKPKSSSGYWRWAKKRLHKIWRRKPVEKLTFTYKDAVGCSLDYLW